MSTQTENPAPIPVLDTEAFRRKLAGLADPLARSADSPGERAEIRQTASQLCAVMAMLFGRGLDRKTLWSRIGTAFGSGLAEVSDDDLDRFCSLCLEHIQADPARVAACGPLRDLLIDFEQRPTEWRYELLAYLRTHHYAVLTHGRARWQQILAERRTARLAGTKTDEWDQDGIEEPSTEEESE